MLKLLNPYTCIHTVMANRSLFIQLIIRNISSRYKGSILGFIWSFIHPLLMLSVYTFVFGIIFKSRWGIDEFNNNKAAFPLIMFCGMAIYNIFSESMHTNSVSIINNQSYVKKVVFPLELLPLSNIVTSFIFGFTWFILLLIGIMTLLHHISWTMMLLPIILIPLFLITTGLSFFFASLTVYLRDIPQFVSMLTQILFFMTPIFYSITVVPENFQWIIRLNPLSTIVEQTRMIFIFGKFPKISEYIVILCISIAIFQLGFAWFMKTKKGFADVI